MADEKHLDEADRDNRRGREALDEGAKEEAIAWFLSAQLAIVAHLRSSASPPDEPGVVRQSFCQLAPHHRCQLPVERSYWSRITGEQSERIASLESKLAEAERTVSKLRDRFPDDVWAELLADDPTPRTCKTCIGYIKPRRDCAECGGTGCGSTDAAGRGEKA